MRSTRQPQRRRIASGQLRTTLLGAAFAVLILYHISTYLAIEKLARLDGWLTFLSRRCINNMREIVHLQAGQCGNQIGSKFWEVRVILVFAERMVPLGGRSCGEVRRSRRHERKEVIMKSWDTDRCRELSTRRHGYHSVLDARFILLLSCLLLNISYC